MADILQLPPECFKIIYFSVICDNYVAVIALHGLVTGIGQVKDGEPPVTQSDALWIAKEEPGIVWSPPGQALRCQWQLLNQVGRGTF